MSFLTSNWHLTPQVDIAICPSLIRARCATVPPNRIHFNRDGFAPADTVRADSVCGVFTFVLSAVELVRFPLMYGRHSPIDTCLSVSCPFPSRCRVWAE